MRPSPLSRALLGSVAFAGLLAMSPTAAHAQSARTAVDQGETNAGLEEIVVTARRVEERLQDAPIAVTAFTSQAIENLGVNNLGELAKSVPGLEFQEAFGRRYYTSGTSIRGVTNVSNAALNFPSVAYFVDGVYVSGSLDAFDLSDIERVEVIKGPQAALYGRATESGAINYVTKTPTNIWEGNATAEIAQYNETRLAANIRGPIVADKLFFVLGAYYFHRDGEYRNLADNNFIGKQENYSFNTGLRFTPTDNLDATFKIRYTQIDDDGNALGFVGAGAANCYLGTYPYFCGALPTHKYIRYDVTSPYYNGSNTKDTQASLVVNYDLDGWLLTSTTGWQHRLEKEGYDGTWNNQPLAIQAGPTVIFSPHAIYNTTYDNDRSYSEELRIASPKDEPIRGLAGIYYYSQQNDRDTAIPPASFAAGLQNTDARNQAVFGQVSWDVIEGLTFTAEARYSKETIGFSDKNATNIAPYNYGKNFYDFNPRFTVSYKVTPDILVYGNAAKGTKPGGFNSPGSGTSTLAPALIPYNEEKLWSYEIGTKTSWFDNRLIFNLALYYQDIDNQQLTANFVPLVGSPTSYNVNAGKTFSEGLEAEFQIKPTKELQINIGYAFNRAEFEDYSNYQDLCYLNGIYTGAALRNCLASPLGNAKGKRPPDSPEHEFNMSVNYTIPVPFAGLDDWDFFLRPNMTFRSSVFAQAENLTETGDQTLVNMRLGFENENFRFTVYGKNIFDDTHTSYIIRYVDFSRPSNPATYGYTRGFAYAPPDRPQYGVELTYKFGGASAPEPMAQQASYTPPPQPKAVAPATSYLVFFDFDKSAITPEASRIIANAAGVVKGGQAAQVSVTGHTDLSGSDAYNLALSKRRAQAVADQLIADGVPANEIVLSYKGKREPLVPTADGVREPQNRRAEIVLQ